MQALARSTDIGSSSICQVVKLITAPCAALHCAGNTDMSWRMCRSVAQHNKGRRKVPVPGSPSSKMPFGGFPPIERYMAGSFRYCEAHHGSVCVVGRLLRHCHVRGQCRACHEP